MGYPCEFNWFIVDKRDPKCLENLAIGDRAMFDKQDYREYPLDTSLFLLDRDWNVLGAAEIFKLSSEDNKTQVNYVVSQVFDQKDRDVLTRICKKMYNKK